EAELRIQHEQLRRSLCSPRGGDFLVRVMEIGMRPTAILLDPLDHRVEGVGRIFLTVVRVDRESPYAPVGVLPSDAEHPGVPRDRVRAVVTSPIAEGRGWAP